MASDYLNFPCLIEESAGIVTKLAGATVKVRVDGAGSDVAESPLTSDANGEIAAGSLAAVAAGTLVHFRIELSGGMSGSIAQITT